MSNRRWFPILCAALVLALNTTALAEPKRPNIVIVMPDDVGYGDFSVNGSPIVRTPNIDAFARESVRFTDFHVSPTCSPTRAALMTGRHEFRSGVCHTFDERERLSLKASTLAQMLKSAGYTTGIFGKWHLGDEAAYQPEKRGFDEIYIHGAGGIGQTFPGSCGDAPGNMYQDPALLHNGVFEKTKGYCTDLFFNQALQWIDAKRGGSAPFFAYITPNAAHVPLQCPDAYAQRHDGQVPDDVAKFYGMIENIDDNFGRLTARLKEWGLDRDTLVIFLTDNGGTLGCKIFNAGMRGMKVTPYQGGTRVPSFWRWPAGFAGNVDVPGLTAHIDVLPTLATLAGMTLEGPLKSQVEGRSLVPLLRDPQADWPNRTFVTHVGRWPRGEVNDWEFKNCSIRDARFTLVNNTELFDLKADPGEKTNVIADHPDEVAKLRAAYDAWWADTLPRLDNEDAVGPKINPFKARYWAQFGGGPDAALRRQMDPTLPAPEPVKHRFTAPGRERPNFLMLFADDLTFRAVGAKNDLGIKTPNLDRLAARGTTFTHASIQGGLGGAVCVTSRAMLFTGRHIWHCGKDGDLARADKTLYPSWGQTLGNAGYRTFAVGKWHNGQRTLDANFQTARPIVLGGMLESTPVTGPAYHRPAPGNPWTPDDPKWKGHWLPRGADGATAHSSERWADAAIDHLGEASKGDRPFFVYVAFHAPHDPRQAPKQYLDVYSPENLKLPPNLLPRHPFDLGGFGDRDEILAPYPRTEAIVRTHLHEYAAIISHLDAQIGRVLDALDRSGQAENTVVVFTGDNGLALGQHGLFGKQSLYDHSIRVPLIVAGPGIPSGRRIDALVDIHSLFATTCDMAGVRIPAGVELPSLVPLLTGTKESLHDDFYGAYIQTQRLVRTEQLEADHHPRGGRGPTVRRPARSLGTHEPGRRTRPRGPDRRPLPSPSALDEDHRRPDARRPARRRTRGLACARADPERDSSAIIEP